MYATSIKPRGSDVQTTGSNVLDEYQKNSYMCFKFKVKLCNTYNYLFKKKIFLQVLKVPFSRTVDGDVVYQNDHIQNEIYSCVLKQMYRECKMFISTFSTQSHDSLLTQLDEFYEKYLPTLRIQNCDILDLFQGIQFLPLDKMTFLHIQSCINLMQAMFPFVKYSMFLCHEQLVW
ncbi:vacuolar fusion protein CCZ1 homolog [Diaphorina citri]|uniref:Vacuolar fusion protein CCZ1 homolog n=1 Tax=Diaphorina citri TaxID=121845 RepID=A0A1S4ENC6_DIACI|nr:vacuolar fusion protein CCZ1 homolog [Diaphorina citri]